ncbi:MAG: hypothetical protein Rubg2KO_05540 [Rubricoccaceae bacterium]
MTDPAATLTDFATLAFVIAHGADADLDTRELEVLTHRIESLSQTLGHTLSEAEVSDVVRAAAEAYARLAIADANPILARLGRALDPEQRREVYAAFVEIAAADGSMHRMEQTLLRHIATAWHLD